MRFDRRCSAVYMVVGLIVFVLGVAEMAWAQEDGCPLIVKRDKAKPWKAFQVGCAVNPSCVGGCQPAAETDTYGNSWAACDCPTATPPAFWCKNGFLPYDPGDPGGWGQGKCIPKGTCSTCSERDPWIEDPQDPEVEDLVCYCTG